MTRDGAEKLVRGYLLSGGFTADNVDAIIAALAGPPTLHVNVTRLHFELSGWKRGLKSDELRRSLEAAGYEVIE